MAAPIQSSWTDVRVAYLTEQWAKGLSAGQLAIEMGVTRNTIMGKVNRLGLPTRIVPARALRPSRSKSEKDFDATIIQRIKARAKRKPVIPLGPPVEQPAKEIPLKQRKTFMELTETSCRYPYGTPGKKGFFFCGADALPKRPYCKQHFHLAYYRY